MTRAELIISTLFVFQLTFGSTSLAADSPSNSETSSRRPVTVSDAVAMTRLADGRYLGGTSSVGRVAHFAPDGKRFLVLLRKGKLDQNTNEFSLLLFQTAGVFSSAKPELVLRMWSSSNRDAIKNVNWLEDNETVAFVGENPGQIPQVYTVNVRSHRVARVTSHATPIVNYAISGNGRTVLFAADPPSRRSIETEETRRDGMVVTTQQLYDVLAGDDSNHARVVDGEELFTQAKGKAEKRIPTKDYLRGELPLSLSPDGKYAVFTLFVRDVPKAWEAYQDAVIHEFATQERSGVTSRLRRFMLLDTETGRAPESLLDAPVFGAQATWKGPGETLQITDTYLPLDVSDPAELEERKKNKYTVEISLPSKEFKKLEKRQKPSEEEEEMGDASPVSSLEVSLEENVNAPPLIYVQDSKTKQKKPLFDLNPQFKQLSLGKVENVKWNYADGRTSQGGLYLPPDYIPGKRYPLVIQTHGFHADRFSMDGLLDWTSGFAARMLTAKGFLVLQSSQFADTTIEEGPREMARYEGAIDYLDGRGLIDRDRVGIVGFSRTFFTVGYTLTHSRYRFSAATLVDGIDAGYFQYIVFSNWNPGASQAFERLNGGSPFGETFSSWLKNSPSFNFDKIRTPLRIVALSPRSLLSNWEWFSALFRMGKPVDLIYLPDAAHIIVKPWEQRAAQEGLTDWFSFWLNGEEDPDPAKGNQYARWRKLRDLQKDVPAVH